jgi:hypothetical protein
MKHAELMEKWEALPEDVRGGILDEHREKYSGCAFDYEFEYDTFKEDMALIGISVDHILFSGFWSQGDGACFEGSVSDWGLFLASEGYNDPVLIDHLKNNGSFSSYHNDRYFHEYSVSYNAEFYLPEHDEDECWIKYFGSGDEFRDAVLVAALNRYDHIKLEDDFQNAFRRHMRDLYGRLEEAYEYMTSDETILENLIANDLLEELIHEHTNLEHDHE